MPSPAYQLHLETPTEFPLVRPFRLQGWLAAAAPITAISVGSTETEWMKLADRPDVRAALPQWPHVVGFSVLAGNDGIEGNTVRITAHFGSTKVLLTSALTTPVLPPDHLQIRQVGSVWGDQFYVAGQRLLQEIASAFAAADHPLDQAERILDFGCGCGRVLRAFREFPHRGEVWGSDIDAESIAWNRANLASIGQFDCNPSLPRTAFPDGFFDAIYSVSVFTHLPEEMQNAWLAELRRILRPGGVIVASVHGEHYWQNDASVRADVEAHGFCYRTGTPTAGLPDFYMVAFHSTAYIQREWSRYFEVVAHHPRHLFDAHDAVVLRRRTD